MSEVGKMGRRILSFGVGATHARMTRLTNFEDTVCLSDYEALVFDPFALRNAQVNAAAFFRRQAELGDLVQRKGGLVVCFLRPPSQIQLLGSGQFDVLSIFEAADLRAAGMVRETLRMGTTTRWGAVKGAMGVTSGYLSALMGRLQSEAFLQTDEARLKNYAGKLAAGNSAGWPVAVEFESGPGRLCFVPVPQNVPEGQLGSVIARMVEEHYGGPVEIDTPGWADAVSVPGADAHIARISELERQQDEIGVELSRLGKERSELLNFRVLLYGYGKSVLEPAVRRAFEKLGFKVLEPEEYEGEWDVDLTDEASRASAVGEVEGSEGAINVDKLRQLLDYVESEENEGRSRKGILVGNGYRLRPLDQAERGDQFTQMAVTRAARYGYCLIPTTELFAAVCAVLKSPTDDGLKKHIRDSVFSTVGPWKLTTPAQTSGTASAGAD
ncbi:MAG TPA: hypothetical protein VFN26_13200 [Candidatus Acidoferrum sp.]|nr:hypothetical protein [Candidatus Acidoferrum sp.]